MMKIAAGFVGVVAVVVFACGGQAPFACGSTTCSSGDDICVHPCCGGAPPQCEAADDAGTCPQGTTVASPSGCENYSATNKCLPAPCTPPAPYCAPKSSSCPGAVQDPQNCYEGCA